MPMQAVVYSRFGPPEVLEVKEVARPVPKDNEVLVRIHATAVVNEDPGMRRSPGLNGFVEPKHPILGQELAGEVESVGRSVTRFEAGDEVYGETGMRLGTYAQYTCMPEDGALALKPANLSYEEAAAIPNGALTALAFLRDKARIRSGQEVLIHGASGAVGTAAVQLAKYFGAEVTGVCSTANLELVQSLGADRVIDYTKGDFTKAGRTCDIIFSTVGKTSFTRCKGLLKQRGIYLATVLTPGIVLQTLWTSMVGGKKALITFAGLKKPREKAKDLAFLNRLIEAGDMRPVIDRRYPLDEIAEAHRYVAKGHKRGNVVITVNHK